MSNPKTAYYASIGPLLKLYEIDVDGAQLHERDAVPLPAKIQYAWPHPSRRYLYVVSSNGGPGTPGDKHFATAFAIDPATGRLHPHGEPAALAARPIHASLDRSGGYLLTAYNEPSSLTVHRIGSDGSIGAPVAQAPDLDTGIYAHQILATPSNRCVVLVTRGNNPGATKTEDPGAIKTFTFEGGKLRNLASISPGKGFGFGPRHLDFHPSKPWAFVSIERQNKLYVYELNEATGLSREPIFIKETLANPKIPASQGAGAIHVDAKGKFVYLTNRTFPAREGGREASLGGEDNLAVYAIDQNSGEPKPLQHIDGHGVQLRTFGIEGSGRVLVAASIMPMRRSDGTTVPAGLTVFRVAADGTLAFARKYDIEVGAAQQFWSGMIALP
jgi:6-phosphogluconolactonase (cycloisomerase 2 family)